jgi:hypothetical protein
VGLIAAELERQGIATVCVQPVRHIAEKIRPPRSLVVPFPLGFPLGRPHDAEVQHGVLAQMLAMLQEPAAEGPVLREWVAER